MNRNQLRNLIGGLSFTTALFVFQACYGMPQDYLDDVYISGKVVSQTSGLPIEGIKVEAELFEHYGLTDSQGEFSFYTPWADSLKFTIEDTDPSTNGAYLSKDTLVLSPVSEVFLNIALEEN